MMVRRSEGRYSHAYRALRHRNFKLFFVGQSISVIGTWMTRLATSWLVYHLTHSALMLGIVGFSGQIVSFFLGPFAGVWVERLERRKLLVWTQAASAVQSLALAVLTFAGVITLEEIIALAALQGLINSLDMPGRQSFLVQMVQGREDLGNAIAINSSMANGARLIGPAIAGIVIASLGEAWCFPDRWRELLCRYCIAPYDAYRTGRNSAQSKEHDGTNARRVGITFGTFVRFLPIALLFAVVGLMGWPYSSAFAAGICRTNFAWRPCYAWIAYRCIRNRGIYFDGFAYGA